MTHKDENIVDSTGQRKFFKLLDFFMHNSELLTSFTSDSRRLKVIFILMR